MVSSVTKLIGKDGMKSLEKGLEPDKKAAKKVKEREEALHASMKNSYGAEWGDGGYFYFPRGETDYFGPQGPCGILGAVAPPMAPDLDGVVLL